MCQENFLHTIKPPTSAWTADRRQERCIRYILSCSLHHILTLPSKRSDIFLIFFCPILVCPCVCSPHKLTRLHRGFSEAWRWKCLRLFFPPTVESVSWVFIDKNTVWNKSNKNIRSKVAAKANQQPIERMNSLSGKVKSLTESSPQSQRLLFSDALVQINWKLHWLKYKGNFKLSCHRNT